MLKQAGAPPPELARAVSAYREHWRGLGLTVCPISNSYVTDGLKAAAVKAMLDRGMGVTVNSDDPAYFPGYMNENLLATQRAADLSAAELVQLTRNAFTCSWLDDTAKAGFIAQLEAYAAAAV